MLRKMFSVFGKFVAGLWRFVSIWKWRHDTGLKQHELVKSVEAEYRKNMLSIETENLTIGPQDKQILLWGCRISVPPGAVKFKVNVEISVIRPPADFLQEEISITPALQCKPELTFDRPVAVFMPTMCGAYPGKEISAWLFCKNSNTREKWLKDSEITLKTNYHATFNIGFLSNCVVGIKLNESCLFRMVSDVYIQKKTALIVSFLCWDDAMLRCFTGALKKEGFHRLLSSRKYEKFKIGWALEMELVCEQPKPTLLLPESRRNFIVTRKFLQKMELQKMFYESDPPLNEHEGVVKMKYMITAREDGKIKSRLTSPQQIEWPIESEDPLTTPTSNTPPSSGLTTITSVASRGALAAGGNINITIVIRDGVLVALGVSVLLWLMTHVFTANIPQH